MTPQVLNQLGERTDTTRIHPLNVSGQLLCLALSLARFHEGNTMVLRSSAEYFEFRLVLSSLKRVCTL